MSQGNFFREFLRSSSVYAIGLITQRVLSLFLLPIYTRYLTPADYGTLEMLDIAMMMFSLLAGGRVAGSIIYFYKRAETEQAKKEVLSTGVLGCLFVGLIGATVGALLAGSITASVFAGSTANAPYLRIMLISFMFSLPLECCLSWLRAENRAERYVLLTCVQIGLLAILNIVLVAGYQIGFSAITWSTMITNTTLATWQGTSVLRYAGLRFNRSLFREMVVYAAPVGIVGLSAFVFHVADRFFLQSAVSLAEIGIYALAYKLGMLVIFIQTSFNTHWTAKQFDLNRDEESHLYARLFTYLMTAMATATFVVWVFTKPTIHLLTTEPYWPATQYVPWILLAYVLRTAGDYFRSVFYIRVVPRVDAILSSSCMVICLLAYWWLIPRYHIWGAIYATMLAFLSLTVGGFCWARRLYPVNLEWTRLGKLVLSATPLLFIFEQIQLETVWAQLALAAVLSFLYPLALIATGFLTPEEGRALKAPIATLRLGNARSLPPPSSVK